MTITNITTLAAVFVAFAASTAAGQPAADLRWRGSIELDPVNFVSGGYSVHLAAKPSPLPSWRFVAGAFALRIPDFITELDDANAGWNVEIEIALDVQAHYMFSGRRGWYVGAALAFAQMEYTHGNVSGAVTERYLSVMPNGGYQWFPFADGWAGGLFINTNVGVGINLVSSGTARLGDREFSKAPWSPLVAVTLGYER